MTPRQKLVAVSVSLLVLAIIIDLVRRRRLREEYSVLWLLTGGGLLVLSLWYDLLRAVTAWIGAVLPTSTLFFFGLVFLILVCLQFSVRLSRMTTQIKDLSQRLSLLDFYVRERQRAGRNP